MLNKHYEKLVQCDPRLKALVEGTLGIGPSPLYDQSDAMFAGHSPLHLSKTLSPLTNVLEGYYQPLSAYSSLQGMCKRTGVFPEQEADMGAMDVHMSDISSPTSGTVSYLCDGSLYGHPIHFWTLLLKVTFFFHEVMPGGG